MNYRRIRYLIPLQCRGIVGLYWNVIIGTFLAGLLVFSTGVGWDGEYPTLFGQRELNLPGTGSASVGIPIQLASYGSIAWVIGLFSFAVPAVLMPLVNSFSLTQTVWMRGLSCTPREVAAARATRLMAAVTMTSLPALIWASAMGVRHEVPIRLLLTVTLGWTGHILLAGGLVLHMGRTLTESTQRVVIAFLALMLPVVLGVMCFLWGHLLEGKTGASWLPYACPMTHSMPAAAQHYASAALLGIALTAWSIIVADGRVIEPPKSITDSLPKILRRDQ